MASVRNILKISVIAGSWILLGEVGSALLSKPAFAEEAKRVRYVGELGAGAGKGVCPLTSRGMQIDIRGTEVRGYYVNSQGNKARF